MKQNMLNFLTFIITFLLISNINVILTRKTKLNTSNSNKRRNLKVKLEKNNKTNAKFSTAIKQSFAQMIVQINQVNLATEQERANQELIIVETTALEYQYQSITRTALFICLARFGVEAEEKNASKSNWWYNTPTIRYFFLFEMNPDDKSKIIMSFIGKGDGVIPNCNDTNAIKIAQNSIRFYDRPPNSKAQDQIIDIAKAQAQRVATTIGGTVAGTQATFWIGNALLTIGNLATFGALTPAQIAFNTAVAASGAAATAAQVYSQARNLADTASHIQDTLNKINGGKDIGIIGTKISGMEERMSPFFQIMECFTSGDKNHSDKRRDILAEFIIHAQYVDCLAKKYTQTNCAYYFPKFKDTFWYYFRNDRGDAILCNFNGKTYSDMRRWGYNYQLGARRLKKK